MIDILVLSVGASSDPLEQCIKRVRPRRVVYICSQDTLSQVDKIHQNTQISGFDPDCDILILLQSAIDNDSASEIDQLDLVYERCRNLFDRLLVEKPGAKIQVDYTGGTKTMTSGLALAAIDDGRVEISVMTQENRKVGERSIHGISRPKQINSGSIHFIRLIKNTLDPLLRRFDYAAAQDYVSTVISMKQENDVEKYLNSLTDKLQAFDAWDRWDLDTAFELLKNDSKKENKNNSVLSTIKRIRWSRDLLNQEQNKEKNANLLKNGDIYGLEAVEDLLLNAKRRALQERFDDAVGRLYRSMELTAQLILQIDYNGIRTSNIELDLLPEHLKDKYSKKRNSEKNRIEIALAASFDLLADLNSPEGLKWKTHRGEFVSALDIRNNSILAHGFKPITCTKWQQIDNLLGNYLRNILDNRRKELPLLCQFPDNLRLLDVLPEQTK